MSCFYWKKKLTLEKLLEEYAIHNHNSRSIQRVRWHFQHLTKTKRHQKTMPSLKLTNRLWKSMIGRWSFSILGSIWPIFSGALFSAKTSGYLPWILETRSCWSSLRSALTALLSDEKADFAVRKFCCMAAHKSMRSRRLKCWKSWWWSKNRRFGPWTCIILTLIWHWFHLVRYCQIKALNLQAHN